MCAVVALLCAPADVAAQTAATVSGSVADASGGALPGVQLTLRNQGTSLTRSATSGADGRFVFPGVLAGLYELRAELTGFRPIARRDLSVTVAQALSVSLVMEVGGVEQGVTVSGGASAVNTET